MAGINFIAQITKITAAWLNKVNGTAFVSLPAATYGGATASAQWAVGADGNVTLTGQTTITGVVPAAHAASHKAGGSDAIKLDELAAPTDVATLNASVSAHGLLPKLPNDSTKFLNGVGAYAVPAYPTPAVGTQIGYANTATTVSHSTASNIPLDGTIPQNTEGAEYTELATAFTPSAATSLLEVEVFIPFVDGDAGAYFIGALFRDAGANALQVAMSAIDASGNPRIFMLKAVVAATAAAATTFKFRYGLQASTAYVNRRVVEADFGAASIARMIVREIKQ